MKRIYPLLAALLLLAALTSCEQIFGPDVGNMEVDSYPEGALISLNGTNTGHKTPYSFKDQESGEYTVTLSLENHQPYTKTVSVEKDETTQFYASMLRGYGALSVNTEPSGAVVTMNRYTYDDTTPLLVDSLESREYDLVVNLPGYDPCRRRIKINMDDTTVINLNMDSILGWVNITSEPPGANIHIDNSLESLIAPTLDSLPPGDYVIRADLAGYHTSTRNVTVSAFDTTSIHFELALITGGISVVANPDGAFILVDNLPSGEITPAIILTTPGDHIVSVQKAGYYNVDTAVHVIMNDTVDVEVSLSAKPTSISINSSPVGARISINNVATEYITPHVFADISPGDYDIRLNLAGFFPVDTLFTAALGIENRLTLSLTLAPDKSFAYTIGDTIFVANMDGINTDTLAVDYDDYISSYISHYGRILWSPDGSRLAYSGDAKPVSIVGSDGSWVNGFSGNRSMDFAWSPNGGELAYGYYCGGIYKTIMSTNWYGKISSSCYDHSPAYSPSGHKIMYILNNWGTRAWLKTMNSDGSGKATIYGQFRSGFDEVINLYWTTDSTAIFKLGGKGVYEVLIPDSGSVTLTKPIADGVSQLRLSADRQWCAYNTSSGLYLMSVHTWSSYRISDASGYDFSVMSGGQYVACRRSDGVHFIDRNGNDFHVIKYPSAGRGAIDIKP